MSKFKRYFHLLFSLLLIPWFIASCSGGVKMVKRNSYGTATWTPFLPKATFTSTITPVKFNEGTELNKLSLTGTIVPGSIEETPKEEYQSEVSTTPSLTPSIHPTFLGDQATSTQGPSSATPGLLLFTQTTKPSTATEASVSTGVPTGIPESTLTSVPEVTSLPAETSLPPATSLPSATLVSGECTFSGNSAFEDQVIVLINQKRSERGLSPLVQNSSLRAAARRHSEDMACNDFFSHTGSDGSTLSSRLLDAGYSYSWAAENIAASSSSNFSAQAVVTMWMNSTGHRNNMLSENAIHIGVGFRYAGDSSAQDFDAFYTADFGRQ